MLCWLKSPFTLPRFLTIAPPAPYPPQEPRQPHLAGYGTRHSGTSVSVSSLSDHYYTRHAELVCPSQIPVRDYADGPVSHIDLTMMTGIACPHTQTCTCAHAHAHAHAHTHTHTHTDWEQFPIAGGAAAVQQGSEAEVNRKRPEQRQACVTFVCARMRACGADTCMSNTLPTYYYWCSNACALLG